MVLECFLHDRRRCFVPANMHSPLPLVVFPPTDPTDPTGGGRHLELPNGAKAWKVGQTVS